MTRFDRTETALIEKIVREKINYPQVGIVDQVFEHSNPEDDSNWEVDVLLDGKSTKLTRLPVHMPGSGSIAPPKKGDKILVIHTKGQSSKPVAFGNGWSNIDRPPLGRAGMYRNRFAGGESPTGKGDLYITGYSSYDGDVASTDKRELEPEETFVQITKHDEGNNMDPTDPNGDNDVPMKIEMYDSPTSVNDESYIHLNSDEIDQDENLGMDVFMNMKTGQLHVRANNDNDGDEYEFVIDVKNQTAKIIGDSNSGNKMGASFNFDTDQFSIADGNKFGIKSDGSGNFTWDHKSIDFNEIAGSTGTINI